MGKQVKKIIFIICILILSSFCFANTEDESINEEVNLQDIEHSMEDMQNQLLQILEDEDMDSLDILQEDNDEYLKKNEEIEKVKIKIARNKRQNDYVSCWTLGLNFPFSYFPEKQIIDNSSFPFGVSIGWLSSMNQWSCKVNLNWDYLNKYINKVTSLTFSLGRTPIHNHYFLIGYYFTFGSEIAKDDGILNIGASGTMAFKLMGNLRLYFNIDALYRDPGDEKKVYFNSLVDTWRISPSMGFVFGY